MEYYFHLRHDGETATDTDLEGMELPDTQAARLEAVMSLREILSGSLRSGVESREGEMIVKDKFGDTVLTVPFSMRVRLG